MKSSAKCATEATAIRWPGNVSKYVRPTAASSVLPTASSDDHTNSGLYSGFSTPTN